MAFQYSRPIEELIERTARGERGIDAVDVLIVGSGYGGAVCAMRLCGLVGRDGRAVRVMVLERGKEYQAGEFPNSLGELPGYVRFQRPSDPHPIGYPDALFDLRLGEDVDVLVGSGLGGTSLINANVAARPRSELFKDGRWPADFDCAALEAAYGEVETWLDAQPARGPNGPWAKYDAFSKLVNSLGGVRVDAAHIAVTQGPPGGASENRAGIRQPHCTGCGNCVTGCNVGAKNSLPMNLIPYAHHNGVSFYTGASVVGIEETGQDDRRRWRVSVRPTACMRRDVAGDPFHLYADIVVLAAGALGSTEILKRSSSLGCSAKLGAHFSTNGDGIAMSFGQGQAVHAIGSSKIHDRNEIGPTITGMARIYDGQRGFTLEEGAVPSSLTKLFGEVVTTGALLHRQRGLPRWFGAPERKGRDPIAYDRELLDHCQFLLVMGDDGADLKLEFPEGSAPTEYRPLFPSWGSGEEASRRRQTADGSLGSIFRLLAAQDGGEAFDGGQFVPNPLWQPLPEAAMERMSGRFPRGRHLTVHPLGGCRMANSVEEGVVDYRGRVFRPKGGVYEGLYVMDGSVVPCALATNPFLTIAAIAWHWSEEIRLECDWQRRVRRPETKELSVAPVAGASEMPVKLALQEQLIGRLEGNARELADHLPGIEPRRAERLLDTDGLMLRVRLRSIDVHEAFSRPSAGVDAEIELYANSTPAEDAEPSLLAAGTGTLSLMRLDAPANWWKARGRALRALCAYARRRSVWGGLFGWLSPGFWNVALMHAQYRTFDYDFELETSGDPKTKIFLKGRKLISWQPGSLRLWDALTNLRLGVELESNGSHLSTRARLRIDAGHMLDAGLVQVDESPSTPDSVMGLVGLLGHFFRSIFQASFWEFGAPTYPKRRKEPRVDPMSLGVESGRVEPTEHWFRVPIRTHRPETGRLRLLRYRGRDDGHNTPVLLIHGLAQGSSIFSTDKLKRNMASYLWDQGYDVWLLDYRLSNALRSGRHRFPFGGWSIDVIGEVDIPRAVKEMRAILEKERGTPVRIYAFAHCVGAVGLQMGILRGKLGAEDLAGVCFNAIHPWIVPSPTNIVRSKLGAFARDWISDELLDPIVQCRRDVTPAQTMLDRLAFSVARYEEDPTERHGSWPDHGKNLSNATCDRMTLLYGRMWQHENLERKLTQGWRDIVGEAPSEVMRQLYYMLERGRLLDDQGRNEYLKEDRIRQHWRDIPTFFIHGEKSEVFNPESATKSAARLKQILEQEKKTPGSSTVPVAVKRLAGYGHMDPILAKDADQRSYRYVHGFFGLAARWHENAERLPTEEALEAIGIAPDEGREDASDRELGDRVRLAAGPILRAAWIHNGSLRLRYWLELWDMSTSEARDVRIDPLEVDKVTGSDLSAVRRPNGRLDARFRWYDCEFPRGGYRLPRVTTVSSGNTRWTHRWTLPREHPPWVERLERRIAGPLDDFNFVVASCRYPGMPFEVERSDRIFRGMLEVIMDRDQAIDQLFLVGDQIYADATADLFDSRVDRDRYTLRYRSAFISENAQKVLSALPVHFAIDDHEIRDDWSGEPFDDLDFAVDEARSYLGSAREAREVGRAPRPSRGSLWYALDHTSEAAFPTFVMDARSERQERRSGSGEKDALMSADQLRAFRSWLEESQKEVGDKPKFVFAGQPIVPLSERFHQADALWRNEDGFAGYPHSLDTIVDHILASGVRNLVFVGGDKHMSCASRLGISSRDGFRHGIVWQIVASGLYSPMPFANAAKRDFAWHGEREIRHLPRYSIRYESIFLTAAQSHFVRVGVSPHGGAWRLSLSAFDPDGRRIGEEMRVLLDGPGSAGPGPCSP